MVKFRYVISAIIGILLMTAGCQKETKYYGEYNPDYDFQYTYLNNYGGQQLVQSSDDGDYVYYDGFIYFYNAEKKVLSPLCSKANCMHEYETDSEKLKECNAYAGLEDAPDMRTISYFDGYVYYIYSDILEGNVALYRVSEDGRKKELLVTFDDVGAFQNTWFIHRGYIYYYEIEYFTAEYGGISARSLIKRLKLGSNMKADKAQIVYQTDESVSVSTIIGLIPYKNYIYFTYVGTDASKKYDGSRDMLRTKAFRYDVSEEKCTELVGFMDTFLDAGYEFIEEIVPYSKGFLIKASLIKGNEQKFPIFAADENMENIHIFIDNVKPNSILQTDGEYVILPQDVDGEDKIEVQVYNYDAEFVDSFIYPINITGLKGSGRDRKILEFISDDDNWYLKSFDLSTVGNYNGAVVELENISTRKIGNYESIWGN